MEIRVRVYTYTELPGKTLAGAKKTVTELMSRAGLRALWADCQISIQDERAWPACAQPPTTLDLTLRILDETTVEPPETSRERLGYAWIVPGRFSSIAGAYFHRAVELQSTSSASPASILGYIVAHELGHLLLGDARHAAQGIMKPSWDKEDLRAMARGRLGFSREEALRMRSKIEQRRRAVEAEQVSGRPGATQ